MKNFDNNNIEMFDAYLNGEMSISDRKVFEALIASNKELKQEFKDYKELLYALQSTCSDADKEFEEAMRGISDDDMQAIVSAQSENVESSRPAKKEQSTKQSTKTVLLAKEESKSKVVPLKTVYRWMSAAAVLLLVVGIGAHFFLGRQAKNRFNTDTMCDNIAKGYQYEEIGKIKGSNDSDDKQQYDKAIELIKKDKTDEAITILEKLYKKDIPFKSKCTIALANAYVKNHDINNAMRIIKDVRKAQDDNLRKLTEAMEKQDKKEIDDIIDKITKTNETLTKLYQLEDKLIEGLNKK